MTQTHHAICRVCHIGCAMKVDIKDGVLVKAIGDKDNPVYFGYSCVKGRQWPVVHRNPGRILQPLKRTPYGRYEAISAGQAMDEIATKIQAIIDEFGPRAIAAYSGAFGHLYLLPEALCRSMLGAIGSPMAFTNAAIDQPGKPIAMALHGHWSGGMQPFESADVCMLFGANPLLSKWGGIPAFNPAKRLKDAKARGLKLIVVDPRVTETARQADIHLQARPGCDPIILAGMINWIIAHDAYDKAFVTQETSGFETLRQAVAPLTLARAAAEAGVPLDQLTEATRLFAAGPRGMASAGTGSNMAKHGTLAEYLLLALNSLCGRWLRAGEPVHNPRVMIRENKAKAQASRRMPAFGFGEKLRVHGLTNTAAGMPTGGLLGEILTPGEGQVKALFANGGNPVESFPDQIRMGEAMKTLMLSVTLDIRMSATARMSDYVFGTTTGLEEPCISLPGEGMFAYGLSFGFPEPYGQYQPKLIDPPAGSEVMPGWEVFYGLAQRLGLQLNIRGRDIDMVNKPSCDDLLELLTRGSRIPLAEVKKYPGGHIFEDKNAVVAPKDDGWSETLDIAAEPMIGELNEIIQGLATQPAPDDFPLRLISCRLHDVYNSALRDIPVLAKKQPFNPAFVHPDDLDALGIEDGEMAELVSPYAAIKVIVEADARVRRGVVALAHGQGGVPDQDDDIRTWGSPQGRLIDSERDYDKISGLPRMSAIPVRLAKYA
ncbi:MAG: molybdopterin oxidoreductase family protein [Sphingomonadales bacterium]